MSEADLTYVHDLVAIAMGAARDAEETVAGRGPRAGRLKAVKADIEKNLANDDVGSEALAKRHQVSPRYIRKLFEGEGTSLSQFVLGRRLSLAHRRLLDPRCDHLTIGSIAFDAGFGDLSTFNHAFRRHFGATPSDVRQSARTRARSSALGTPAKAAAASPLLSPNLSPGCALRRRGHWHGCGVRGRRRSAPRCGDGQVFSNVSSIVCEKGSGPAALQSRGTYSGVSQGELLGIGTR
ncbi:helix-turn-helix transcriptional regulator [Mesorhizobium sp. B1-1-8]|uniref:helix-turn-helix transcriptional regulator n=1 Tax=Mesorhizobium sp. B1-1-8 TaxID=2589976 RepID=UPI001D002527|nr:helix-turn-helix transcriptional regulator [Mesorhizobium sp. B1-1-8]UCI05955.1 helix-turn-helix transcriptional regulator [Mesorhizobium sp. B1-1-8]